MAINPILNKERKQETNPLETVGRIMDIGQGLASIASNVGTFKAPTQTAAPVDKNIPDYGGYAASLGEYVFDKPGADKTPLLNYMLAQQKGFGLR